MGTDETQRKSGKKENDEGRIVNAEVRAFFIVELNPEPLTL